jgi:hypothetical protein
MPSVAFPTLYRSVDFNCQCAAEAELDAGEEVYKYSLQPQRKKSIKTWIFSRVRVLPATFLILTNRRIMTISTSKDRTNDRYGIMTCYTAPCNLHTASVERTTNGLELCLEIKNSRTWQISFADEQMPSIVAILGLLKRTFGTAS